jgi:Raf kinase inhibitor-like YbhB/YbcL family protein
MSRICNKAVFLVLSATLLGGDQMLSASCGADPAGDFKLTSSAFQAETIIPRKHTCDGLNTSPPLAWSQPPTGTKAFALIVDDPDAPGGTWVHWVVYDLPGEARSLPEAVPKQSELSSGARQGRNDFPSVGYGGPCPPPGPAHHYHFKLYALDGKLDLKSGATKAEVEKAMRGHVLGEGHLVGRYGR